MEQRTLYTNVGCAVECIVDLHGGTVNVSFPSGIDVDVAIVDEKPECLVVELPGGSEANLYHRFADCPDTPRRN